MRTCAGVGFAADKCVHPSDAPGVNRERRQCSRLEPAAPTIAGTVATGARGAHRSDRGGGRSHNRGDRGRSIEVSSPSRNSPTQQQSTYKNWISSVCTHGMVDLPVLLMPNAE